MIAPLHGHTPQDVPCLPCRGQCTLGFQRLRMMSLHLAQCFTCFAMWLDIACLSGRFV